MKDASSNILDTCLLFTGLRAQLISHFSVYILLIVVLGGCRTINAPFPVHGDTSEVAFLKGEWRGEFSSMDTGRSGDISFILSAQGDSAVGSVIMNLWNWDDQKQNKNISGFGQPDEVLSIRFVSIGEGRVVGRLSEYKDPACGCALDTIFEGHLEGDRIEGIYMSHGEGFHLDASGQWWVERITSSENVDS